MSDVRYPLREGRKRRTRAALVDAGRRWFGRNSFMATTTKEIAEQAAGANPAAPNDKVTNGPGPGHGETIR